MWFSGSVENIFIIVRTHTSGPYSENGFACGSEPRSFTCHPAAVIVGSHSTEPPVTVRPSLFISYASLNAYFVDIR